MVNSFPNTLPLPILKLSLEKQRFRPRPCSSLHYRRNHLIMEKRSRTMDVDRISSLDGNLRNTILECLPVRDAVRTSTLSRSWRYSYVDLPKLIFDDTLVQMSSENQTSPRNKLVSVVYQVLLFHRGPITEFELSISLVDNYSDIDSIMRYLSLKDVETLSLYIVEGGHYKLPSSLYYWPQLKHLNLEHCIFKPPPSIQGLTRLTSLFFCNVTFDSEKFGSFISNCVLLESLWVQSEVAYKSFIIDAPKLRYLNVEGFQNPLRFKSAPLLETIELYPDDGGESTASNIKNGELSSIELLRHLPTVEDMKINYVFLKSLVAGIVPVKHLNISMPLKVLYLCNICFTELDEVSCSLELIRSSTKLRKIVITIIEDVDPIPDASMVPVMEYLKALDYSKIKLDQLRQVQIKFCRGLKVELEFIKLLLATSTILEEILIMPDLQYVADKGLAMLKEMIQFERASRQAKIIFKDPPPSS